MLWIEFPAGHPPIIYRAKKQLYLVPKQYIIKTHVFKCTAHAVRELRRFSDHYAFADIALAALLENPNPTRLYRVQRKRLKQIVKRSILVSNRDLKRTLDDERQQTGL